MQFDWQRGGRDLVVAVQGCAHGALDDIYASLQRTEQQCGVRADVLLCCGDFQALLMLSTLPAPKLLMRRRAGEDKPADEADA